MSASSRRRSCSNVLHLWLKGDVAVLAGGLGVIHGQIGVAEQRLGGGIVGGKGHADARRHANLATVEQEGRSERLDQRIGDALHFRSRPDAFQQHPELIAAEPRDGVGRACRLNDALRHRLQQPVAGIVSERIVDVLEVVDIEEHDRRAVLTALREG